MAIEQETEWHIVIAQFLEDSLKELGVAMPGNVVSYDRATQTAKVRPAVSERMTGYNTDETFYEDRPDIFNVPVLWPGGSQVGAGSSYFHPGLEPGAGVLLVCMDTDFSQWRKTGKRMNPRNDTNHRWTNVVCLPGFNPKPDRLPDSNVILAAGGVLSAVALAPQVTAILAGLATALSSLSGSATITGPQLAGIGSTLTTLLADHLIASKYIKTGDT